MLRARRAVYVVTRSDGHGEPLLVTFRFAEAKAFVLAYNRLTQSDSSVIRPGVAHVSYVRGTQCQSPSTS